MQPPLRLGLCGYFVTLGKVESLQPKAPRPSPCSHIFCHPAFLPQMPGCGHLGAYTSHPLYLDHAPLLSASVDFHCSIAPENPLLPDHVPGRALVFCPGRSAFISVWFSPISLAWDVSSRMTGAKSALFPPFGLLPLPWSQTTPHLSSL